MSVYALCPLSACTVYRVVSSDYVGTVTTLTIYHEYVYLVSLLAMRLLNVSTVYHGVSGDYIVHTACRLEEEYQVILTETNAAISVIKRRITVDLNDR